MVFKILFSGGDVIRMASVLGRVSIRAMPFSAPITVTAVERASASVALSAMIVTLDNPSVACTGFPVDDMTVAFAVDNYELLVIAAG